MPGPAGNACTTNVAHSASRRPLTIGIGHEGKRVVAQSGEIPYRCGTISLVADAGDHTPAFAFKRNCATAGDGASEQERARSPEISHDLRRLASVMVCVAVGDRLARRPSC